MQERWLDRFAGTMGRVVPDALTASVVLLMVLVVAALALGNSTVQVVDAYYRGLWMLLPFTMQMTLIIVLSATLATAPSCRRAVAAVSRIPKTANQVVVFSVLVSALAAYLYWGLGMALSPIAAVYFAREAEKKVSPSIFHSFWQSCGQPTPSGSTDFRPAPRCWWPHPGIFSSRRSAYYRFQQPSGQSRPLSMKSSSLSP